MRVLPPGPPIRLWLVPAAFTLALTGCDGESASQALADNRDYRIDRDWASLPEGRQWGAVTGVWPDPDGEHIWVLDRCGADTCLGSPLYPIFKFDLDGNLIANFGGDGLIPWPHGLFVDHEGNVWVTDAATGARALSAEAEGKGHQVFKFSPDGRLLMTLGTAGQAGQDPHHFQGPSVVAVAANGDVFVADGHGVEGNNRIVRFDSDGRFLREWGTSGPGPEPGEFADPHALAFDSQGRLFIADRRNNRIQIYTQDGEFLEEWTHLGVVSGLFIDEHDTLFAMGTEALPPTESAAASDNGGSEPPAGIWIVDARTGRARSFIPSDAEYLAVDQMGNIYGAEIQNRNLVRFTPEGGTR